MYLLALKPQTLYIIIGISALVLIIGVIFVAALTRKKKAKNKSVEAAQKEITLGKLPKPKTALFRKKYWIKKSHSIFKNNIYDLKAKIVSKDLSEKTTVYFLRLTYLVKKIRMPEFVSSVRLNIKLKNSVIAKGSEEIAVKVFPDFEMFKTKTSLDPKDFQNFDLNLLVYNFEQGLKNKKKQFEIDIPLDILEFVQTGKINLKIDSSLLVSEIGSKAINRSDIFKFYNLDLGLYDKLANFPDVSHAFSNILIYNNLLNNQNNSLYEGRIMAYIQEISSKYNSVLEYQKKAEELTKDHKNIMNRYKKGKTKKFLKELDKNILVINHKASLYEKVELLKKFILIFDVEEMDFTNINRQFLSKLMKEINLNYYGFIKRNEAYREAKPIEINIQK